MDQIVVLFPLFVMGLVSSAHCLGMCGGIMGALSLAIPADAQAKRWLILLAYNAGRISSYTLMGLLAGVFAQQLQALVGASLLRILAGVMMVAMGLYLADWWRGLTRLENLGRYLWVYIQPWGKKLMPVTSVSRAFLLGGLWGWLPCGLVYAALASALTQPAPLLAAGAMLAFGLGTLPAVLAAGFAAQALARALQQPGLRLLLASIVMALGIWVIWAALVHGGHDHSAHEHIQDAGAHEQTAHEQAAHDHEHIDHEHGDHSQSAPSVNDGFVTEPNHAHHHETDTSTANAASASQRTDSPQNIPDNDVKGGDDSTVNAEEHHHH